MPNPLRLAVLSELREAAGLNQTQAAECCGLRGRQSRKTLAAWEMGQSTPRQRYRGPVALYLLRDLGLGQDLARFDAIFEILVEEWEWPPLEKEERVDFIRLAGADPQRSLPGSQPHPRITISGDEVPADGF
ncbi:MAG: helix-turn-helix domain-containing protein, partial [Caldilineaceae bacterium]|nr:helix-turn-helix domain-containing protein [Caldilineaceae bacterium]